MSVERRAYLADLRPFFEAETQGLNDVDRLKWLFAHLDEYLDRWIAFSGLEHVSMAGFLEGDLHIVLVAAVDLIDQEITAVLDSGQLQQKWHTFSRTVRAINSGTDKDVAHVLKREFDAAYSALLTINAHGGMEAE